MHGGHGRHVPKVGDEVTIGDGVDAVAELARTAELARRGGGVDRIRDAREGARAQRRRPRTLSGLRDPRAVASKCLDVGQEVMRERDDLRSLQMRVPGHDRLDLVHGAFDQRASEIGDRIVQSRKAVDGEEAQIEGDLVVPAPSGMELPGDLADDVAQPPLDDAVDVFVDARPRERFLLHLLSDSRKAAFDGLRFLLREDPLPTEHSHMGKAAANVVERDPAVELKGACESGDSALKRSHKSPGPERLVVRLGQRARFLLVVAFVEGFGVVGADSAFLGMSSDASLPSPQSACVRAWVRSGRPNTLMNPSDARWSNASPFPYVASDVE